MPRFVEVLLLVIGLLHHLDLPTSSFADCRWRPQRKSEDKQPIFLNTGPGFIIPKNGSVLLGDEETVRISCPNRRNHLTINSKANETVGVCVGGKLKVEDVLYDDFNELRCNRTVLGDVLETNSSCGPSDGHGRLFEIGYRAFGTFHSLITACYDNTGGRALYSEHIIYGQSIRNASRAKYRPSFSTLGLGPTVSASVAYKRPFQKSTFNKILGSSSLGSKYINKKNFLTRGHHAPDADFHFAAWQFCTYFYINASPQWNRINGGNWALIENLVRRVAGKLERDLRVFTGTHGVLSLNDTEGNLQEMYLIRGNVLPVPEYNWKLVLDEETEEAIVLLVVNNPYILPEEVVHICEDSCLEHGWHHKSWNKTQNGAVFCCDYPSFEEAVGPLVPSTLNVSGVLRGPY